MAAPKNAARSTGRPGASGTPSRVVDTQWMRASASPRAPKTFCPPDPSP
jgi:hypothetical protein